MSQEKRLLRTLKQELIQLTGNKVYYRDLNNLFERIAELDLKAAEKSALRHLCSDIRSAKIKKKSV